MLEVVGGFIAQTIGDQLLGAGASKLGETVKNYLVGKPSYRQRLGELLEAKKNILDAALGVNALRLNHFWQLAYVHEKALQYRLNGPAFRLQVEEVVGVAHISLAPFSQADLDIFCVTVQARFDEDEPLRTLFEKEFANAEVFKISAQQERMLAILEAQAGGQALTAVPVLLDIIESTQIHQFKARTALGVLELLQQRLEEGYSMPNELRARLHFLRGVCLIDLGRREEAIGLLRLAVMGQPTVQRYRESLLLELVRENPRDEPVINEATKALRELVSDSAVGWGVWVGEMDTPARHVTVPPSIRAMPAYQAALLLQLVTQGRSAETQDVLLADWQQTYTAPLTVDWATWRDEVTQALVVYQQETANLADSAAPVPPSGWGAARPRLREAHRALVLVAEKLAQTELAEVAVPLYWQRGVCGVVATGEVAEFDLFRQYYRPRTTSPHLPYLTPLVLALVQHERFVEILELLDGIELPADDQLLYLRGAAYQRLERLADARADLSRYAVALPMISEKGAFQVLMYLLHCGLTVEERLRFWQEHLAAKPVSDPVIRPLLQARLALTDEWGREQAGTALNEAISLLRVDTQPLLRLEVVQWCHSLQRYEDVLRAAEGWEAWPPELRQAGQRLRLSSWYHLKRDSIDLLEALRNWRLTEPAERAFFHWEISLAQLARDWKRVQEVSEQAREMFPADRLLEFQHLWASHTLGEVAPLRDMLEIAATEVEQLSPEEQIQIASWAARAGYLRVAVQLLYPAARPREALGARHQYLNLMSRHRIAPPFEQPERAEEGTTVVYSADNAEQVLELSAATLAHNPLAAQLAGKQPGDQFAARAAFGPPLQIEVKQVLNRYDALQRDIFRQVNEQRGALPLVSFTTKSEDEGGIVATMRELLEMDGSNTRDATIRWLLWRYETAQGSFSEVVLGVCEGNPYDAYYALQGGEDSAATGIRVLSRTLFGEDPLAGATAYVLDFSTLPLVHELHRDHHLPLPGPLWVSRCLVEMLEQMLLSTQLENPPAGRTFLEDGHPRFVEYPDDYQETRIARLQELLAWTRAHCQTRPVYEKLDIIRELESRESDDLNDERIKSRQHVHYAVDTIFLADQPGAVLVSDDLSLLNLQQAHGLKASSELFVQKALGARYVAEGLPLLLRRNYRSLTVELDWVVEQFIAAGHQVMGLPLLALRSTAAFTYLMTAQMVELINFCHQLALATYELSTLTQAQKREQVRALYRAVLRFCDVRGEMGNLLRLQLGVAASWQPARYALQQDLTSVLGELTEFYVHLEASRRTAMADEEDLQAK